MEGCFMFQWGWGVFQMGGGGGRASFLSGKGCPMGTASVLIGGLRKKIVGLGEEMLPYAHPTMGNPD